MKLSEAYYDYGRGYRNAIIGIFIAIFLMVSVPVGLGLYSGDLIFASPVGRISNAPCAADNAP